MKATKSEFGKQLRIYRVLREMTQADLAAELGCSTQFVCAVESGVKRPPASWFEKLPADRFAHLRTCPRCGQPIRQESAA